MKTTFAILTALLATALGALMMLVVVAAFVDWNRLTGVAETMAAGVLGREVNIKGLSADLGWTTTITLHKIQVANPADMEGTFFKSDRVKVSFKPWAFVVGAGVISEVILERPTVTAVKRQDGTANWIFGVQATAVGETAAPEDRAKMPEVKKLLIRDGTVKYHDTARGFKLDGGIEMALAEGQEHADVEVSLQGDLENKPVSLKFRGAPFSVLQNMERPYPFTLEMSFGETQLLAEGEAKAPLKLEGLNADFTLSGPSLADLFPIFLIPFPPTPSYKLSGDLKKVGSSWSLDDFNGQIGESDLQGSVSVSYQGEQPAFQGKITSTTLRATDLEALIGASPEVQKKHDGIFPETELPKERLRAANMDVRFHGEKIEGFGIKELALTARFRLQQGRLHVTDLAAELPTGKIAGEVMIDASLKTPAGKVSLLLNDIDLSSLLKSTRFAQETKGKLFGRIELEGSGEQLAEIVGRSEGNLTLALDSGTLSALFLEAIGVDVAEALLVAVSGDSPVSIRCASFNAPIKDGVLRFKTAFIDTIDSILVARGTVGLGEEEMDLEFQSYAKDFSLLDLAVPVTVRGTFRNPNVGIGTPEGLPLFELGETEDIDCKRMLKQQREN